MRARAAWLGLAAAWFAGPVLGVEWESNFKEGMAKASRENKPIFVYFGSDG